VIDAMLGLLSLAAMRRYYRVNKADWFFFMGAMVGILTVGIIAGILVGVTLSLLLLVARSSLTSVRPLGRDTSSGAYQDAERHRGLETIPGIAVLRVDGPLFFADADRFKARVEALSRERADVTGVVLEADAIHLTDTDGADIVIQVAQRLRVRGVAMALAQVHPPVAQLWARAGLTDELIVGSFDTTPEAVAALQGRGMLSRAAPPL
jgi:sulfate permease, SulP family